MFDSSFDPATQRVVNQLARDVSSEDREAIERMLIYLGRCSLPALRIEGADADKIQRFVICGEVDQYKFSVDELVRLWSGLKQGRAIQWDDLNRA